MGMGFPPFVAVGDMEFTDLDTSDDIPETEIQIPTSRVRVPNFCALEMRVTTWLSENAHEGIQWLESLCSRSPGRHVLNSAVKFRSKCCTKPVGVPSQNFLFVVRNETSLEPIRRIRVDTGRSDLLTRLSVDVRQLHECRHGCVGVPPRGPCPLRTRHAQTSQRNTLTVSVTAIALCF